MDLKNIENILSEKFGINPVLIGSENIAAAVQKRMHLCSIKETVEYIRFLTSSNEEAEELFEMIVVPETWFFRDRAPFVFLKQFMRNVWLQKNRGKVLKVLSAPCSTGEEAYSIAITLIEAGLKENDFNIKAVDISSNAIKKAHKGVYDKNSFRSTDLNFQKQYFTFSNDLFFIAPYLKNNIKFIKANLKDSYIFNENNFFDLIFCRNLLIYLDPEGKRNLLNTMDRILKTDGIIFLGYAETFNLLQKNYAVVDYKNSFAFIKKNPSDTEAGFNDKGRIPLKRKESILLSKKTKTSGQNLNKNVQKETGSNTSSAPSETLFQKARKLADNGFVEEALSLCQRSITEEGPRAASFTLMGVIEDIMGNTEKSEEYLGKALYLEPDNLEAMTLLILIMEKQNKNQKATLFRQRAERLRNIYV